MFPVNKGYHYLIRRRLTWFCFPCLQPTFQCLLYEARPHSPAKKEGGRLTFWQKFLFLQLWAINVTCASCSTCRVSDPPRFMVPEPGLVVCSQSIEVDVSLYRAERPEDFSFVKLVKLFRSQKKKLVFLMKTYLNFDNVDGVPTTLNCFRAIT